jgi:hypothetical protein
MNRLTPFALACPLSAILLLGPAPSAHAATVTVTTNADSGAGSLRQAIADAAAGDTITFDGDYVIVLGSQLTIAKSLTISAGRHVVVLSGGGSVRLLTVNSGVTVVINDLTLTNGYRSGEYGGALVNHGTLTLNRCTATNNVVTSGSVRGGMLYNDGTFAANECTFSGNGNSTNTTYGGVLYNTGAATFNFSTFHGNGAVVGSVADNEHPGQLNLINCTLASNQGSGSGAAGAALENSGTLNLSHVTMANNTGSRGSAIDNWGLVNVWNSVFSGNSSGCLNQPYGSEIRDNGGNVVWNSAGCPGLAGDPKLGVLQANGGRTPTMALLPGSVAIDLTNANCQATDQRGIPRPQHGTCDSGAFEANRFYVDRDAVGAATGLSWADAYTNLDTALLAATSGAELWVAEGVYRPANVAGPTATFTVKPGVSLYGGFAATETSLSQRTWTAHPTILSGDIDGDDTNTDGNDTAETWADISGSNAYHVVTLDGVTGLPITGSTLLDGFTITAGSAQGSSAPNERGGGLFCAGGGVGHACSPTLTDLIFSGNQAYKDNAITYGGALYNDGSNGGVSSPALTNVHFTGNRAGSGMASAHGGALCNNGYRGTSSPTLTNVTFTDNLAASANGTSHGGALYNNGQEGLSSPVLNVVTFTNNRATNDLGGGFGGGMYNHGYGGASHPILANVVFTGNSAAHGGGMYNDGAFGASSPALTNVVFVSNRATSGMGGGLYNSGSSSPTLTNVLFAGNRADSGGGMVSYANQGTSRPRLTNVTFSGNAAIFGGAMYNGAPSGTCVPNVVNSIFWGNTASNSGPQIFNADAMSELSYTTMEGSCPVGSTCGAGMLYADPRFVAPAPASEAPTTTGDYRLAFGSPAIDVGDTSVVTAATDLDGSPRVRNSTVDLGAYESSFLVLTVTRAGNGGGDVVSTPEGVACGATCAYGFAPGSAVTLTATPLAHSTFTGWTGGVTSVENPVTFTPATATAVTATFTLNTYNLTVAKAGEGSGVVTPTVGAHPYLYGDTVTLTATADTGSAFSGWTGDPDCTDAAVTISGNLTCTATFTLNTYTLTVETVGNGSGVVDPTVGEHPYLFGDPVTLTATADTSSTFAGWSGDADCADGAVTVGADMVCTATFTLNAHTLTMGTAGNGSGVVAPPVGANPVLYGDVVTLAGTADTGSTFAGWSGDADCADGAVTVTGNVACTATFTLNTYSLTVETAGNGNGVVDPTVGEHPYLFGEPVMLTATAATGSTFTGWSGDADCADGAVTVTGNVACTATFTLNTYSLTVETAGNGSGVVTPTVGVNPVLYGDVVTLTATAASGSTFAGWSGDADCVDGTVTVTGDVACTATFTLNAYTLTVETAGNGSGVVEPTVGAHSYFHGDAVSLTATADTGSTFAGWSGDADCADGAVTVTGNVACTATFTLNAPANLMASNDGPTTLGALTTLTATVTGGVNVTCTWDLGDGNSDTGCSVTHRYAAAGYFTASVTAMNAAGSVTATTSVAITNLAPVADAGENQTVAVGQTVTLDGGSSQDPDGHLPLTYNWTQTDGPAVTLSAADVVSPTFVAPATPAVLVFTLVVTDAADAPSTPVTTVVIVTPAADAGLPSLDASVPGHDGGGQDGGCGSPCTACILSQRPDVLASYVDGGWSTSCADIDDLVLDWCAQDTSGCLAVKTGPCAESCGVVDAGTGTDANVAADASVGTDAGVESDASTQTHSDGAVQRPDSSVPEDAGTPSRDAALGLPDAGVARDSGHPAAADAGVGDDSGDEPTGCACGNMEGAGPQAGSSILTGLATAFVLVSWRRRHRGRAPTRG